MYLKIWVGQRGQWLYSIKVQTPILKVHSQLQVQLLKNLNHLEGELKDVFSLSVGHNNVVDGTIYFHGICCYPQLVYHALHYSFGIAS